ncbi:MAG: CehA/McbA family metallohydrolase [Candidatus Paceibacterota bacterium]
MTTNSLCLKAFFLITLVGSYSILAESAEIIQITESTRHLIPQGKIVSAIDGDWIMKNDQIIAVIGNNQPSREANMRVQSIQGAVIAFTKINANNNTLSAYYPQGYPHSDSRINPNPGAHEIKVIKRKGSEVILQVTRKATERYKYQAVTEYTLKDGESFLRIKTTYTNLGSLDVPLELADRIRLDNGTADSTPPGRHNLAFIYNKWFYGAYGIYSQQGLYVPVSPDVSGGPSGGLLVTFGDAEEGAMINLKAGQEIEETRYLFYGRDVAEIQRDIFHLEKNSSVLTPFQITDYNGESVPDVCMEIYNNNNELVSFAITNEEGQVEIPLAAASYKLQASKIGRDTLTVDFSISSIGETAISESVSAVMEPFTGITFQVIESESNQRLPVKIEFRGMNGTPDPYLGSINRAEGAANYYYAINKDDFQIPVRPGQYAVIISHGPEYDVVTKQIELKHGDIKSISAELNRAFTSKGWVIADFHNHTSISGDNDSEFKSRIINLAGAGIEFAPATEHNLITSYTDEIKRIGLQEYLASAAGIELTGYPGGGSQGPNHQNAFPLTIQTGKQGGGFSDIGIKANPYDQMKALLEYNKSEFKFVQHNHPNIPWLYFDKNRDGTLDDGFGTRELTDAVEIQDEMYRILDVTSDIQEDKESRVFYWLQMLNQGDKIFGTTTSDGHTVGPRTGERFIYVKSKYDKPIQIDPKNIAMNAKGGHMVMSNGPFINLDINGYFAGDEIKGPLNEVDIYLEVYGNNQVEIERVQILINGRQDKNLNFTKIKRPDLFYKTGLQFKHTFQYKLDIDSHMIVVATGSGKTFYRDLTSVPELNVPTAITNPIFIDVNGDGFKASMDLLDRPLPVIKIER